uniref:Reverse transcriptase domain-containing protein n=1 Tax=Tanacetum cinerariifolium TaxID=118510 RepID=A0A699H8N4_TANCI|nr:reverse transcriptase domain-containing protein [Tanacetum cinerariifolium]
MPPRMRTRSVGRPAAESLGGGTGVRVGEGGRVRRPREGNDERVDDLNGQGNDQGMGANGGIEGVNGNIMPSRMRTQSAGRRVAESQGGGVRVGRGDGRGRGPRGEGVNRNVKGVNEGTPDFSTIIAQELENLLPAMLAQVGNQGNVGNQNGCSYKELLACNPKDYDDQGGAIALTRWIKKMESVQDMNGCSIHQKVKYTAGSFMGKALTWWNSQICMLSREVAVSMLWNNFKFMMIE